MNEKRPMSLSRTATLYWHEGGEWEPVSRQWAHLYEPLDFDGPSDCRPYCHGFGHVDFYDATGNKLLAKDVGSHAIGASDDLICIKGIWYSVLSAMVVYHEGAWKKRFLCAKNTRWAIAVNAGFYAYNEHEPWLWPVRWLFSRIAYGVKTRWRELVSQMDLHRAKELQRR